MVDVVQDPARDRSLGATFSAAQGSRARLSRASRSFGADSESRAMPVKARTCNTDERQQCSSNPRAHGQVSDAPSCTLALYRSLFPSIFVPLCARLREAFPSFFRGKKRVYLVVERIFLAAHYLGSRCDRGFQLRRRSPRSIAKTVKTCVETEKEKENYAIAAFVLLFIDVFFFCARRKRSLMKALQSALVGIECQEYQDCGDYRSIPLYDTLYKTCKRKKKRNSKVVTSWLERKFFQREKREGRIEGGKWR